METMDTIPIKQLLPLDPEAFTKHTQENPTVPPWLFKHQSLIDKLESARIIDKNKLTNTINYLHFIKDFLYVYLSHPKYEEGILIKAYPAPCLDGEVTCHWVGQTASTLDLDLYRFQQLIIANGQSVILVPGRVRRMDDKSITIQLPEKSYDICQRKVQRHTCRNIHAEIVQNGVVLEGIVVDFSPLGICIRIVPESSSPSTWFNTEEPATVYLKKNNGILFSSLCRCVRQMEDTTGEKIVFAPLEEEIARFKKAKVRSPRRNLVPPPVITFTHPFSDKQITRELHDLSNSGFSVLEQIKEGVLMPGMIIPSLSIHYAGAPGLHCRAQVIYRKEEDGRVRCGLAILDMGLKAFSKLNQILNQVSDPHNYVAGKVDLAALWQFFFETNFIYPKKYKFLHLYRDNFIETYRKLYQENPEIARHFTYERDGKIYGHIAMVWAYERAWMIHHFAAKPMENKLTGFLVLKQILQYINGLYRFPSAHMDYVMTYFRDNNRIIDRIFGGFTRQLNDQRGSSIDKFSYLIFTKDSHDADLPPTWNLRESTPLDIWKLELYYKYQSGGLLLNALGLGAEPLRSSTLAQQYKNQGFIRRWKVCTLIYREEPVAFLIVNQSDLGFNLSELLNGIKIIVTDIRHAPWHILLKAISRLSEIYDTDQFSLMIYPSEYTDIEQVSIDKYYQLWIINVPQRINDYLQYMEQNFRIRLR